MPGTMTVTADHITRLVAIEDGLIGWWASADGLPVNETGETLSTDGDRILWLGRRAEVLSNDNTLGRTKGTTDVLVNTPSAVQWLAIFDGDTDAAAEAINAQIVHDADTSAPDCEERDPETGFTCTLTAGHAGGQHVAGTGHACIAHVFTVGAV